jgi:integrase
VRRTLSLTKDGHVFEQPKNGKGRSIELTQAATEALRSHLRWQLAEIEALGDNYRDQGLIFPGEHGQPMRPWTLTRKFQRILERVALPHIRFHDLRHTCATLLLLKGVHPKFVQELLGHATILHYSRHLFARYPSYGRPDEEGHGRRAVLNTT